MRDEVTYRGTVYPWHCDHVGHMNVMWYVGKFDEGTWNLLARIGITAAYVQEEKRGMVAVQQNLTYKRELIAGDVVEVRSRMLEVGTSSLRFAHEMRHSVSGETAALCELKAVHFDRIARKSLPLPKDIKAAALTMMRSAPADTGRR